VPNPIFKTAVVALLALGSVSTHTAAIPLPMHVSTPRNRTTVPLYIGMTTLVESNCVGV